MNGISKFESELQDVACEFPTLNIEASDSGKILKGKINIGNESGNIVNNLLEYSIEIHPHSSYPHRFPLLYETDGVIPRIPDWHVYPGTGNCCVAFTREEEIRCFDGITLLDYIKEYVIPFLKNTTFRRIEGYYYTGEYCHSPILATYQFYKDLLLEETPLQILKLLNYIKDNDPPHRVSLCFCGKIAKYRHCHKSAYEKVRKISPEKINEDISSIQDLIKAVASNKN